ncbi:MAG: hypothetical protein RL136_912 [Planctomycetota bacterium]
MSRRPTPSDTNHRPPARAAVFCRLLARVLLLASAACAPIAATGCAHTAPARATTVTITLPEGRTPCFSSLALPADLGPDDEIVIDGRGKATLVGGIDIERPEWRTPEPAMLARLPEEARAHARVLAISPAFLSEWSTRLHGPVHAGHTVEVPFAATEVFVGGRPLVPARWPNKGFAAIERIVDVGSVPRNDADDMPPEMRKNEPPRGGVFVPADRTRLARWRAEAVAAPGDLWLDGYWNWDWSDETLPLASIDTEAGTIALGMPHRYGLAERGKYRITNVLAELDEPGECWIDRANARVIAWLPPGAEHARVTISMLEAPMIALPAGAHAPRVTIRGVRFEATRGAAIVGRGVCGARIEDCTFANIGTRAVDLEGERSTIAYSTFEGVGGTAVRLVGGDRRTLTHGANTVADSRFTDCSRLQRSYNPAIDIAGVGQRIEHNEISELPHFAILFAGCEHLIEGNHIHHVVRETGDAGAVYVGRDYTVQGTVLRGNLVHDIEGSEARYQNAFYLDDMTSGILIERNLFVRCNWGLLIGGGRDNIVRDNAFAKCGQAVVYDARGVGWMAFALADPSTSTILKRLAATPIEEEPWRSRYPLLRTYLTDRPSRPVGGRVVGNALLGAPIGRIEDRTLVEESGTITLEPPAGLSLDAACDDLVRRACEGAITVGNARLGPVGPRARP